MFNHFSNGTQREEKEEAEVNKRPFSLRRSFETGSFCIYQKREIS